jgi:hypothetical protein
MLKISCGHYMQTSSCGKVLGVLVGWVVRRCRNRACAKVCQIPERQINSLTSELGNQRALAPASGSGIIRAPFDLFERTSKSLRSRIKAHEYRPE